MRDCSLQTRNRRRFWAAHCWFDILCVSTWVEHLTVAACKIMFLHPKSERLHCVIKELNRAQQSRGGGAYLYQARGARKRRRKKRKGKEEWRKRLGGGRKSWARSPEMAQQESEKRHSRREVRGWNVWRCLCLFSETSSKTKPESLLNSPVSLSWLSSTRPSFSTLWTSTQNICESSFIHFLSLTEANRLWVDSCCGSQRRRRNRERDAWRKEERELKDDEARQWNRRWKSSSSPDNSSFTITGQRINDLQWCKI